MRGGDAQPTAGYPSQVEAEELVAAEERAGVAPEESAAVPPEERPRAGDAVDGLAGPVPVEPRRDAEELPRANEAR